jgi:hypothetical protein
LEDAAVTTAYEDAVVSVVSGESVAALVAALTAIPAAKDVPRSPQAAGYGVAIAFPLEYPGTRWLNLTVSGLKLSIDSGQREGFFNPVDWLVIYQDIDVDAAFPGGLADFNAIQQRLEETPRLYPTKGLFYKERSVGADLASSRLNVVSTIVKALVKALDPKLVDDRVVLPPNDAMYLVRGVGPSVITQEDFDFVTANLPDVYLRVVAVNLAAAAMELASLVVTTAGKPLSTRRAKSRASPRTFSNPRRAFAPRRISNWRPTRSRKVSSRIFSKARLRTA